jgi:hypothetical protein
VIDAFAEYANSRGITFGLFGVMNAGDRAVVDPDGARRFARTVAARLQGNAVIISPPVDDDWDLAATMIDELPARGQHSHVPSHLSHGHRGVRPRRPLPARLRLRLMTSRG